MDDDSEADAARPGRALSEPETWLERHGDALYAYALFRTRDTAAAEDLVQDTLIAAFQARGRFAGLSSERTWLIAILKNKLKDYVRRCMRERPLPDTPPEMDDPEAELFDAAGGWLHPPSAWDRPDTALEQRQFWEALAACLRGLPPRQSEAFTLCELDGLDAGEACNILRIAATNLRVLLHRARLGLRQCLEVRWFAPGPEGRR